FIEVVDKSGEKANFDYHQFSGLMRSITKNVSLAQERNSFTIDWENPGNELYLHEHPYLIPQLLESGNLINIRQERITSLDGIAHLNLQLREREEKILSAHIQLLALDEVFEEFQFL